MRALRKEPDQRGLSLTATTVTNGHLDDPSHWPQIESEVLRAGEMGASAGAKYLVLIDYAYVEHLFRQAGSRF